MNNQLVLKNSYMKVNRARALIKELDATIELELSKNPPRHEFEEVIRNPKTGQITSAKIHVIFEGVSEDTGLILGDIIHNLRSSLDLMACDLVENNGLSAKNVCFPFASDAAEFNKMITRRNFHRTGNAAVELLKTFKPYKNGNKLLRAIHDIDIRDKHIAVVPVAQFARSSPSISEDRREIAAPRPVPLFQFPATTALSGSPLFETLEEMVELVVKILDEFSAVIAPKPPNG